MLRLYKNIRYRRIELGLTQDELAERLGYSGKSMIAKIEAGKVDLPQSKIELFADALQIPPLRLMGWEQEEQEEEIKGHMKAKIASLADTPNDFIDAIQHDKVFMENIKLLFELTEKYRLKVYGYIQDQQELEKTAIRGNLHQIKGGMIK